MASANRNPLSSLDPNIVGNDAPKPVVQVASAFWSWQKEHNRTTVNERSIEEFIEADQSMLSLQKQHQLNLSTIKKNVNRIKFVEGYKAKLATLPADATVEQQIDATWPMKITQRMCLHPKCFKESYNGTFCLGHVSDFLEHGHDDRGFWYKDKFTDDEIIRCVSKKFIDKKQFVHKRLMSNETYAKRANQSVEDMEKRKLRKRESYNKMSIEERQKKSQIYNSYRKQRNDAALEAEMAAIQQFKGDYYGVSQANDDVKKKIVYFTGTDEQKEKLTKELDVAIGLDLPDLAHDVGYWVCEFTVNPDGTIQNYEFIRPLRTKCNNIFLKSNGEVFDTKDLMTPSLDHVWADILVKYIVPTTKHSTYAERYCIKHLNSSNLKFGLDYLNQGEWNGEGRDPEGRDLHGFALVGVYNLKSEMNKGNVVVNADFGKEDGNKLNELKESFASQKKWRLVVKSFPEVKQRRIQKTENDRKRRNAKRKSLDQDE